MSAALEFKFHLNNIKSSPGILFMLIRSGLNDVYQDFHSLFFSNVLS